MRTAIKAHFSGFYFAHSSRGSSPKSDLSCRNAVFPFRFPFRCAPLFAAELRCHELVWEVPVSAQTLTCVRSVFVFMCNCLDAHVHAYLSD